MPAIISRVPPSWSKATSLMGWRRNFLSTCRATKSENTPKRVTPTVLPLSAATPAIGTVVKNEVCPLSYWQPTITKSAPAKIGVDDSAGGGVNQGNVAAQKCLYGGCAGADEEEIHIRAVLLVQAGVFANPKNGKGSGKRRVGDAQLRGIGRMHAGRGIGRDQRAHKQQSSRANRLHNIGVFSTFLVEHVHDRSVKTV